MNRPNVLGFLAAPDRDNTLRAVSLVIAKVRGSGVTYKEIAKALDCHSDTIEHAANEKSLLSFDAVARLCYFFHDYSGPILALWSGVIEEPSASDRLDRIEREVLALRRAGA